LKQEAKYKIDKPANIFPRNAHATNLFTWPIVLPIFMEKTEF
jgi:hypothetical protein